MPFITKKHISRREVLRGVGVALSLPLLDSMVPAQTPIAKTAASPQTRLACIEMVHGAADSNTGEYGARQTWPGRRKREAPDFEFSQTAGTARTASRLLITIVSNTDLHPATAWAAARGRRPTIFRSSAVYLTAAHPKMTEGSDYYVGASIDQIVAQQLGQDTPLPSIQLCIEMVDALQKPAVLDSCSLRLRGHY